MQRWIRDIKPPSLCYVHSSSANIRADPGCEYHRPRTPDSWSWKWDISGVTVFAGKTAHISLQFILVPLPFIPEQSIIVLLIVSVPIAIVWVFIPEVLPLIGQQPEIANEAGKYALWLIPGLFAFSVAQCFSKFLQCQSLIFPMVLSSMITLAVFIPLCWFLVYKVGMGNAGAALSVSICDWVEVIVLGLYIKFSPSCEKTRAPLTWEAFKGIGSFMSLAVPSALMIW
uniref:Protein TRANSPARENT TESTA 12 n=1 Tax=Aegilops tauschii TaxID=37682 RepID=N1R0H6_AEGTA